MSSVTIRDALVTKLRTISGVVNVHTREPRFEFPEDIVEHAVDPVGEAQTEYWVVRRRSSVPHTSEMDAEVAICDLHWHHTYEVSYKIAYVENVSEDTFQSQIDTVLATMQNVRSLDGLVFGNQAPMMLERIQPTIIGNILGEEAVFSVTFIEIVTANYV